MRCGGPRPAVRRTHGGSGRLQNKCEMKMDLQVRELVTLSALAALGWGLAAVQATSCSSFSLLPPA